MSVIFCSTNSKSFSAFYFFFEIQKLIWINKSVFFQLPCVITLFQLSVGYVLRVDERSEGSYESRGDFFQETVLESFHAQI